MRCESASATREGLLIALATTPRDSDGWLGLLFSQRSSGRSGVRQLEVPAVVHNNDVVLAVECVPTFTDKMVLTQSSEKHISIR